MLLAIACLTVIAHEGPSVSLSLPATRLPLGLQSVGKVTGLSLSAAPKLQDEVLLLGVHNVPRASLLKKIASLYDARWERREDGRLILEPDSALHRLRLSTNQSKAEAYLLKSLQEVRSELKKQPESPTAAQLRAWAARKTEWTSAMLNSRSVTERPTGRRWNSYETPIWRAQARMLLNLTPRFLLSIPSASCVVFAEHPTSIQRPLTPGMRAAVTAYRQEMTAYAPEKDYRNITFKLSRRNESPVFHSEFVVFESGTNSVDFWMNILCGEVVNPDVPESILRAPKVELSKTDCELLNLFSDSTSSDPIRDGLGSKWAQILSNPVDSEPLSFLVSGAISTLAAAMKRNVIARPSEDMILGSADRRDFEQPSRIYKRLYTGIEIDGDGWLIYNDLTLSKRPSRALIQSFMKNALQQGGITLDQAADIVEVEDGPMNPESWSFQWLNTLFKNIGPSNVMSAAYDKTALEIWKSLGPDARLALRQGRTIPVRSLPVSTIPPLEQWIYFDPGNGWDSEPYRNGISRGKLSLRTEEQVVFYPVSFHSFRQAYNLQEFGKYLASARNIAQQKFYVGKCTTYKFQLSIKGADEPLELTTRETIIPARVRQISDLTKTLRSQIETATRAALR